ncbi:hypothetical protein BaRGS_00036848 [Batillaria attramentaria]|uniref:Uncharacterized protein n=1 Tax=Batillaria attramentaria TaxID=370345 RepID=A0ABD0JAT0_9CAEN
MSGFSYLKLHPMTSGMRCLVFLVVCDLLFMTLVAVVTFILPALIIASCYIAIIFVIWAKGRNSRDSSSEQAVLNGRQSK